MDFVGEYIIDRATCLGSGGSGTIVLGLHIQTREPVAVKICSRRTCLERNYFEREASVVQKICKKRPNLVCEFKDIIKTEDEGLIFMKKYNLDLFSIYIERRSRKCLKNLKKTFFQICEAVNNLHSLGIAHLDLKLENILIENNNPYICDFGAAVYRTPMAYGMRTTINYAAPEMKYNFRYEPKSCDIYSLGIILFVMLTGNYPIFIGSGHSLDTSLLSRRKVSSRCMKLIASMLSYYPEKRPTILEVLEDPWFKRRPPKRSTSAKLLKLLF